MVSALGYNGIITEGAKHILGWKSPNFLYCSGANPKLKVIVVSADIQEQAKTKVIELGAQLHVQKPINEKKMKDILEML